MKHGNVWNSRHTQWLRKSVLLSYHLRYRNHKTIHWEKGFISCTGGWCCSRRTPKQFQCGCQATNYMPTFNLAWITWVSCTTVRPSNMSHWRVVDVPTTTITSLGQLVGFVRWSSVLQRRLEQSVQYSLVCLLVQFSVVGKGAYLCLLLRVLSTGFTAASSSEEQLL